MHRIAIAAPRRDAYSETFIFAHIERLPADVVVLHGGEPPTLVGDGVPIIPPFTIARHVRWSVESRLKNLTWEDWHNARLAHGLRRLKLDAVLAEYGTMGVSMMKACDLARIPLVVYFRGYDAYDQRVLNGAGTCYPELFRLATAIIAASRPIQHRLVELTADPSKVHYVPSGVDVDMFNGADPSRSPPTFLAVGRFVDKKAPDLTLLAFQKVICEVPAARLLMVGDGPLFEVCQRLAAGLGLQDHVSILGPKSHKEIALRMKQVLAFVQHSITSRSGDAEGTPNALKEAQASKLPVVATRHTGIQDVVVDGITGFLVDEGDVDGMAEAMIRLAKDPQLAARMGQAGRKRIEEQFSMERSIRDVWNIIEAATAQYSNTQPAGWRDRLHLQL